MQYVSPALSGKLCVKYVAVLVAVPFTVMPLISDVNVIPFWVLVSSFMMVKLLPGKALQSIVEVYAGVSAAGTVASSAPIGSMKELMSTNVHAAKARILLLIRHSGCP